MSNITKIGAKAMEMAQETSKNTDYESVHITVEQVSRTISVLASVVDRLQGQLKELEQQQAQPIGFIALNPSQSIYH